MNKRIPKFHILFFSDYTLMGTVFGAVMFAIMGTVGVFGENSILGLGIVFYIISITFALLFFRRNRRLRSLFLYGIPVRAKITRVNVMSMKRYACYCRVHYSFLFNKEKYSSHSMLSISTRDLASYKSKEITILVHPKNPYFTINQDSLDQTVFLFGFFKVLFMPFTKANRKTISKSKNDSKKGLE